MKNMVLLTGCSRRLLSLPSTFAQTLLPKNTRGCRLLLALLSLGAVLAPQHVTAEELVLDLNPGKWSARGTNIVEEDTAVQLGEHPPANESSSLDFKYHLLGVPGSRSFSEHGYHTAEKIFDPLKFISFWVKSSGDPVILSIVFRDATDTFHQWRVSTLDPGEQWQKVTFDFTQSYTEDSKVYASWGPSGVVERTFDPANVQPPITLHSFVLDPANKDGSEFQGVVSISGVKIE
jgi:hypothetical protein